MEMGTAITSGVAQVLEALCGGTQQRGVLVTVGTEIPIMRIMMPKTRMATML